MGVDTKALKAGFNSARKDLNAFAGNVRTLEFALAGFGAVGALAIGKTIIAASNLEEQTDRAKDEFGSYAKEVIQFSNLMATGFGLSKTALLESASSFAPLFRGAGYADKAIADLSIHFVKLATDASRFTNIPVEQALVRLKSGLAGESEAVRRLGVSMLESDIEAYAYAKGIAKVNSELTSSQKIQARIGYLTEHLAKAQGNLAKTGDKVAGAIEGVKGRFENLAATIGDSLLLIAAPVLGEVQVGIQALQTAWTNSAMAAVNASGTTIEGLTAEHHTIGVIQTAIGYIGDAWQVAGEGFKLFQAMTTSGIKAIVDSMAFLQRQLVGFANLIPGVKIDTKGGLIDNLKTDIDALLQQQAKEFKDLNKAPWFHEAVNAGFEKGRKDIQIARDKLLKMGKLDVNAIKPTAAATALGGKEHEGFAHAAVFGEAEATNAILQNAFAMPGARNGAAEKTAANTGKTNAILERISKQLGIQPAVAGAIIDAF